MGRCGRECRPRRGRALRVPPGGPEYPMPTDASSAKPPGPPAREFSPLAGLLSYLVPGLGQITQGRVGKGLLFLACIYTLFFYGQYLGTATARADGVTYHVASNVYLPDTAATDNPFNLSPLIANLY